MLQDVSLENGVITWPPRDEVIRVNQPFL